MKRTDRALKDLARRIEEAFVPLSSSERRLALATLRELARGHPARMEAIAGRAQLAPRAAADALGRWPGVYLDDTDRVIGFWGLSLGETPHSIRIGERTLYGWCAWDTLFLGELLGEELRVASSCGSSGRSVTLTVGPDGIRDLTPGNAVLSFLDPECADVEGDRVISSFCHHILFFSSPGDAEEWGRGRDPQTFLLTVEEGWRLGRIANRIRYGAELDRKRGSHIPYSGRDGKT